MIYIFGNQPDRQQPAMSEQKDRPEQSKVKYFSTFLNFFLFLDIQESMIIFNQKTFYSLHLHPLEVFESQEIQIFHTYLC